MDVDYIEYDDYTPDNDTENNSSNVGLVNFNSPQSHSVTRVLVAVNIIISVMGLGGNSLVIWICGWKMKRTVITTCSVFLLVLISMDRCLMISFPVWSHNHRTVRKALGVVVFMWLLSALLTMPSLIFRQITVHGSVTQCYTDYMEKSRHRAVVLSRFICGFLIPVLMILFCCSVLSCKLSRLTMKSTKPYKVMAALILSFLFCWIPYHTFVLIELNLKNHSLEVLQTGLKVGATLAAANSFISPVLYVFIGNDFKQTLKRSLTSRIEEAMAEDFRTGGLNHSRSKSMEVIHNQVKPLT